MMQKYQKLSLILITIVIDYNKFSNKKVDLKIKQKGLVNKSDITGFINNADLDKKKSGNISNKSRVKSRTR